MGSPFDAAWAASNEALAVEMGEPLVIGGVSVAAAVVDEARAGSKNSGPVVNTGVNFTVYLSRAQIEAMGLGTVDLKGKAVGRDTFKGRVAAVRDLGGAGAELDVGPAGDR